MLLSLMPASHPSLPAVSQRIVHDHPTVNTNSAWLAGCLKPGLWKASAASGIAKRNATGDRESLCGVLDSTISG